MARYVLSAIAVFLLVAVPSQGRSCGPPREAKPQRWTGGESFPPLPLPATPLRRSEKKRQPAPPVLVGKVMYGEIVEGTDENGRKYRYRDWTTDPNDIHNLMKQCNQQLGIRYRAQDIEFEHFSFDPAEIPILYLTGHEAITLSDEIRKKLRWYLQAGGVLMCDACCGSEDYLKGWMNEMNHIFPKRKIVTLPADHPIYNCFYKMKEVGYYVEGKGKFSGPPTLLGINIGCRTSVVLTPFDLSCAWDGHFHDHGKRVWPAEDAVKMGVNMIAYFLATYKQGRHYASKVIYTEAGEPSADALTIGQIVHGGDWDPHQNAIANLLKYAAANSTLNVRFKRETVDLTKSDLTTCSLLYMLGHFDFALSEEEVARLRAYLLNGGVLFAEACCGSAQFDAAFRREIKRVLPDRNIEAIPLTDPLYSTAEIPVGEVRLTPMLAERTSPDKVLLEGIKVGGACAVVYSKYAVGSALEGGECPFSLGFGDDTAFRLGLNVLVYAMTH